MEPPDSTIWLPDLLGNYVLRPGRHLQPLLFYYGAHPRIAEKYEDVRVVYDDGHTIMRYGLDICVHDLVLWY